jgi:polysaccharide deacetylase family protein (PEP-CTERM system associated)
LDRHRIRATFFVLGWVALRHPRLVEQIAGAGHEIASHGHLHRPVYELTPDAFAEDLDQSLGALRAAGATSVTGFRAPQWSINDRSMWALEVLSRKGFRFDSSLAPLRLIGNPRFPRIPHTRPTPFGDVFEFPPLVERRWGQNFPLGGGWGLRMTDPRRVLATIEDRNRKGTPVALFVHPWELDPNPPRIRLPWPKRFVHYFRLAGFGSRLDLVLAGSQFAPMSEVLGLDSAPA